MPGLVPVAAQPLPAAGQQGGVLLVAVTHAGVLAPGYVKTKIEELYLSLVRTS